MDLHLIRHEAVASALVKARQYRSLLEPEMAISICLDIFAIEPDHQVALVIYILALTDSFTKAGTKKSDQVVLQAISRLNAEYERIYYEGIFHERKARGLVNHSMSKSFAYRLFLEAMACYNKAKPLSPKDNDDAVLRYNSCVRTIKSENLEPRQDMDDVHWQSEA